MITHIQNTGESTWWQVAATASRHQKSEDSFPACPLLMMLFDGVLETSDYPLLKAIIFSFIPQWPAAGVPRAERACSQGWKKKKKLSKSQELKWTPLEKIYFRIKRLMLGFHFLTAMGCGNKCQRAGGDMQRPSPITENYLLLPKVVFEPSGLHLRCDWIMAVWHTPLMGLSHRLCTGA